MRSANSGTRRNERIRCAIYTRKSSEEGLDGSCGVNGGTTQQDEDCARAGVARL